MVRSNNDNDLTKQDLEKTLEAHAKTIELQILVSQQQNELIEQIEFCQEKLKEIDAHFSNGFRSELKNHTTQEVRDVKETLGEIKAKLEKTEENAVDRCKSCSEVFTVGIAGHDNHTIELVKETRDTVGSVDEGVKELLDSSWKMWWLFGGIAFFSITNAILTIIALWANGFVLGGGGK